MSNATAKVSSTSERIAEIALRILEEEGPEAVTMRRVAEQVGVTPMAIYHHFPNRDALLKSITDAEFAKLRDFIESRRLNAETTETLTEIMHGYIDYALARPRVFDYVFSKPRSDARRFPDDFRARRSPTLTPVADAVAEAMARGWLKWDDIWEVALDLWAHIHGYVMLYRAGRFQLSEDEFRTLCQRSLRRLLDGLKA
jgi:AcrR family transcriptional regulator